MYRECQATTGEYPAVGAQYGTQSEERQSSLLDTGQDTGRGELNENPNLQNPKQTISTAQTINGAANTDPRCNDKGELMAAMKVRKQIGCKSCKKIVPRRVALKEWYQTERPDKDSINYGEKYDFLCPDCAKEKWIFGTLRD